MRKGKLITILIILVALIVIIVLSSRDTEPGKYDDFAQCLSEQGATFYGAYWCPHCNDQKKDFGNSIKFVNYVECSLPNKAGQTAQCAQKGIESYPTWEFSDGSRLSGRISLEQLGEKTGCSLESL